MQIILGRQLPDMGIFFAKPLEMGQTALYPINWHHTSAPE